MLKKLLIGLFAVTSATQIMAQTVPTVVTSHMSTGGGRPFGLNVFNNKLLYGAEGSMYKKAYLYDGTASQVASQFTGWVWFNAHLGPIPVVNNRFYVAVDSQGSADGPQLYFSTGTGPFIKVPQPGINANLYTQAVYNNKLYYTGSSGMSTFKMYSVDASNTIAIAADLDAISLNTYPLDGASEFTVYNNKIYFVASASLISELMVYDPVNNTTTQVPTTCQTCVNGNEPMDLYAADNGKLYFTAKSAADGRELYEITGSGSPVKLTSINGSMDGIASAYHYENRLCKLGNAIYFPGDNGSAEYELMKYDLTTQTTSLVKDINTGLLGSSPKYFQAFGGRLYFLAYTNAANEELWYTDGTAAGTIMVADLNPGTGMSDIEHFMIYNNKLYFSATNDGNIFEVYRLGNPLGVEAVSKTNGINIYPVPGKDEVNFEIEFVEASQVRVSLNDLGGRTVYTSALQPFAKGKATITVPVAQLPAGVYTYAIHSASGEVIGIGKISH